jgi:fatty-acyl-CoA synthase
MSAARLEQAIGAIGPVMGQLFGQTEAPMMISTMAPGHDVDGEDVRAFVKARLGSVKTPKQVEVWPDLPRSRVGKVLKSEVRSRLLD